MEKFGESFDEFKTPLKFPRQKKLLIYFEVYRFCKIACLDFTSSSETLESLEFHDFIDGYPKSKRYCKQHFLASCSEMRKLKSIIFCDILASVSDTFFRTNRKNSEVRIHFTYVELSDYFQVSTYPQR